jgi:ATP-dependent 26S proteasome regulatory subunit
MHEATRRMLSVFLRYIDGFESNENVMIICATNRKQDLDPALQSRFSKVINFPYPDLLSRHAIFR